MTIINNSSQVLHNSHSQYLLALHSCSETFGIAIKNINNSDTNIQSKTFKLGRSLSNKIFTCIETILPKEYWKQIARVSVATGPGGFTTTRLTIAIARAMSQQIGCSLDSISSFNLMAPRLHKTLQNKDKNQPFWIKNLLPRRGVVAGEYKLENPKNISNAENFIEITPPKLFKPNICLSPSLDAIDNVKEDIIKLLDLSYFSYLSGVNNSWEEVLPIYPTSPVE